MQKTFSDILKNCVFFARVRNSVREAHVHESFMPLATPQNERIIFQTETHTNQANSFPQLSRRQFDNLPVVCGMPILCSNFEHSNYPRKILVHKHRNPRSARPSTHETGPSKMKAQKRGWKEGNRPLRRVKLRKRTERGRRGGGERGRLLYFFRKVSNPRNPVRDRSRSSRGLFQHFAESLRREDAVLVTSVSILLCTPLLKAGDAWKKRTLSKRMVL